METTPIRLAIVDDHTLFRRGLSSLMSEFEELNIVFDAGSGAQMVQMLARHTPPDVILMDITMPVMDGYECTAWLRKNYPQVKVLALSMLDDDKAIIKMIKAGAGGYVLKESKPKELLEAIKTLHARGIYLNELVSGKLMRSITHGDSQPLLSTKETEFLKLCCSELTYKEMADQMFVSPRTVDNYRESLFQKLSVKSRTGLVLYAIQNQFVKL